MNTRGRLYERMTEDMKCFEYKNTEFKSGKQKRNERRKKQRKANKI